MREIVTLSLYLDPPSMAIGAVRNGMSEDMLVSLLDYKKEATK